MICSLLLLSTAPFLGLIRFGVTAYYCFRLKADMRWQAIRSLSVSKSENSSENPALWYRSSNLISALLMEIPGRGRVNTASAQSCQWNNLTKGNHKSCSKTWRSDRDETTTTNQQPAGRWCSNPSLFDNPVARKCQPEDNDHFPFNLKAGPSGFHF
jgi:hypothetical protein